jgi:hypothetical protein
MLRSGAVLRSGLVLVLPVLVPSPQPAARELESKRADRNKLFLDMVVSFIEEREPELASS